MRRILLITLFICTLLSGCSGTGLEKRTTLVPNSVTVGWGQETYHGDPEAWQGFSASATWEFK